MLKTYVNLLPCSDGKIRKAQLKQKMRCNHLKLQVPDILGWFIVLSGLVINWLHNLNVKNPILQINCAIHSDNSSHLDSLSHCAPTQASQRRSLRSLLLRWPVIWQSVTLGYLWHLQLSGCCRGRLHGPFVEGSEADCGRQSFPEHLAEKHVDKRVQAHICGGEPQGRFLRHVQSVLRMALTGHAACLGESVWNTGKMERCKADEKDPNDNKHLCLGSAAGCMRLALWGFVRLINLLADERVANHHQGKRAPENHL